MELLGCAEDCAGRIYLLGQVDLEALSATAVYWEDKRAFYRAAASIVETDPRILRMWGLS